MADLASLLRRNARKLNAAKAEALQRRSAIDVEITGIERELRAIAAYEHAKLVKTSNARKASSVLAAPARKVSSSSLKDKPDGMAAPTSSKRSA